MNTMPNKHNHPSRRRERPGPTRRTLTQLADEWNKLTPEQRQAWEDYADQENRRKLRLPPKHL